MKKNVKNTLIIASLYIIFTCQGHAFDIDATVDDEIRKNYNPTQLIEDVGIERNVLDKKIKSEPPKSSFDEELPALPSITKQENATKKTDMKPDVYTPPLAKYTGGNIRVKAGTSFNVTNSASISDWQRKGANVKFITKGNTFGKAYTIPNGTVFLGEIIDSHQPQITCNGGLIVIKVDTMIYKGQRVPVTAYVTRANDKKIFFNNIKGKRTYLKTTWKKGNWGRTFFDKMLAVTVGLGAEGSTLILTPFPLAYGTVCLGLNTITSPICAFFSKGEHISIPAGSNFRIKLVDDVMIN